MRCWSKFKKMYVVDFEFFGDEGEMPHPVCAVMKELRTGDVESVWFHDQATPSPPIFCSDDVLYIAYYASAEIGCHLKLDWPVPANIIDLFIEFRNNTNGKPTYNGNGLVGALAYFGLDTMEAREKDSMRELILGGGPYTKAQREVILEYCRSDVEATARLFEKMFPLIDIDRALLRGRYTVAAANIEQTGIPIDTDTFRRLESNWGALRTHLIEDVDRQYNVFEDTTFKLKKFEGYLHTNKIDWPRLPSGQLDLKGETFRAMTRRYPELQPLHELRSTLSQLKLNKLAVGSDGRNRCLLSVFRSKTGRNQPSNAKFIFGPAKWLRSLIQPEPGYGLAYIDYEQQEFGIAAALSKDKNMMESYASGDPYLEFAKKAGAVPSDATKATHPKIRDQFKACCLAVQYGMGKKTFAQYAGCTPYEAQRLLELHREIYSCFWEWSDAVVDYAMLTGKVHTVFGWQLHVTDKTNPRTLRNFPMQANGAEILRLACCFATEAGVRVCAPIHDALLVEAKLGELNEMLSATKDAMRKAGGIVLDGFQLRTDVELVRYPDRYMDDRGQAIWDQMMTILGKKLRSATG